MDRTLGRQCTICNHPQRGEIDKALVAGVAYRRIAAEYGVSDGSLRRHKKNGHIAEQIAKVAKKKEIKQAKAINNAVLTQEAHEVADVTTILQTIGEHEEITSRLLTFAESQNDLRSASGLLREMRANAELRARLIGELRDKSAVTVNIIENPQFNQFLAIIAAELPEEVKDRVIRRLDEICRT